MGDVREVLITNKMNNKLTVITPVLNCIRFIESCITNVIEQQCPGVEHVIVDGGSTDGTVEIIQQHAQRYQHIRWVSEKDQGQSFAMNKGLQMASGSIVGFLNADDYYESGALKAAWDLIKDLPEPSLLVGNCNVWNNDGHLWFVSRPKQISLRNILLQRFRSAFPLNPSAYFYHKSLHQLIGPFDVTEHYAMDLDFILKAVQAGHVTYVDQLFGNFRSIEGTKTYEDMKQGTNPLRVQRIIDHHRKQQSAIYQLYLNILDVKGTILQRLLKLFRGHKS